MHNTQKLPIHIQPCLQRIDKHSHVSFDIFDTVLLRPTAVPSHLFWLLEKEVQVLLGDPLFAFQQTRLQAEEEARIRARPVEDITLDQIYDAFADITCIDKALAERIKEKELALELDRCFAHPHSKILYDYAVAKGKTVVFVSDMYLPADFIRKMLEKNGFYTENHAIFMSSETLKTKHTGNMFPYVLSALGCKPASMLHIGDNKVADIKRAGQHGISSFYIPRHTEKFFKVRRHRQIWGKAETIGDVATSLVVGHLAHYYATRKPEILETHKEPLAANWYEFGYQVAGVLYVGFIQWLIGALKANKIDRAFFLSRDGKIMKEAFDLIAPLYGEPVPSSYIYASRRALQVARIQKIDTLALMYISTSGSAISLGEYLLRIGMDPDAHHEAMQKAGFTGKDHIVASHSDRRKVQKFFRLIEPDVLALATKEREHAIGYYRNEGLLDDSKRHAVIDIGWGGMMLYALSDLLKQTPEQLFGFFLGTTPIAKMVADQGFSIKSFLFNIGEPFESANKAYHCLEIVELLFSATHGSLSHFTSENGEYVPVLNTIDCSPVRVDAINQLQRAALDFVRDIMPVLQAHPHVSIYDTLAMRPLGKVLTHPTRAEVNLFRHISHIQDINASQCDRMIVYKPPVWQLFLRPVFFARMYQRVYWRRGFQTLMGRVPRLYLRVLVRLYMAIHTNPALLTIKRRVNRLLRV